MSPENIKQFLYRRNATQTAAKYLFIIENFTTINPRARDFRYKDIVDHFAVLKHRYPNPSTRCCMLSAIKKYYDYLLETKQRNDHPCRMFNIKGEPTGKQMHVQFQDLFSTDELESLLSRENRYKNLRIRNKIIISFLIYQGLTSNEIVQLQLSNIDLDNSTIYIKASYKYCSRTLPLNYVQKEYLEEYLKIFRPKLLKEKTDRLFIGHRGQPESTDAILCMLEQFRSVFPGRHLNPTIIRQSVITNWLNKSKHPLEQVQIWAGHKWPSATQRYRRQDMNEQREKINLWHPLK